MYTVDRKQMILWLLDVMPERIEQLGRLHSPIEQALRSITESCEASEPPDEYYAEVTLGYEIEEIEQLLGVAFVCAQVVLTAIRGRILELAKACERHSGWKLNLYSDKKGYTLFKHAPIWQPYCGFTEIEAINAVANYWKHVDEWSTDCAEREGSVVLEWQGHATTMRIVTALGMESGSTGNLRSAAEALGINSFSDLRPLRTKVIRWANEVTARAKQEIRMMP